MAPTIIRSRATGEEIEVIINERLAPAIADLDRSKVLMALISFVLVLMKPSISSEELVRGVKEVSQWLCLFLSETPEGKQEVMN